MGREMNFTAKSSSPMRAKTDNYPSPHRAFALSPEVQLGGLSWAALGLLLSFRVVDRGHCLL